MDGWVTIGTRLDTKQLKQDLKNAENELKSYEREAEKLTKQKEKAEINLQAYEEEKRLIKESTDELLRYAQTSSEVENTLQLENTQLQALDSKYATQINKVEEINNKIKENAYNQGLANNKVEELNNKLSKVKGFDSIKNSMNDVGKSIEKTIKKVGRWALAVFGIRSAYMAVRNAINVISSNDEQLKADIDYMKNAIAYTLEPLVRGIVNLAKQLMFYVAYIIKAWTGKNIFANANKSLQNANKQAEKLSKTLAGFDEMNVLEDQSSSDGGGVVAPSFDLTAPENVPIPDWIKWIADNKDIILSTLAGIATALISIKFGLSGIKALGFGLLITGIVKTIMALLNYMEEPTWENFGKIITGIGVAVAGLALIFGSLPLAIAAAITTILGIMAMFWDKIENFLNNLKDSIFKVGDNIMNWINNKLGIFGVIINTVIGTVVGVITGAIDLVKSLLGGVFNFVRGVLDGILMIFRGDFKGGIDAILKSIVNLFIDAINFVISALNFFLSPLRGIIVAISKITGANLSMEQVQIPKIPRLARGGIVNNPGAGVMMGSYVAGERGPEAVIPLDDMTLDRLGLAFARHTNINATIPVYVGNRQIAREIRNINADEDFAYNK